MDRVWSENDLFSFKEETRGVGRREGLMGMRMGMGGGGDAHEEG